MKKQTSLFLLILLLFPHLDARHALDKTNSNEKSPDPGSNRLYAALSLNFQWKNDPYYEQVYKRGVPGFVAETGYWILPHLAAGLKFNYMAQKGKTSLFKEETNLRQVSLMGYAKISTGEKFKPFLSLGVGCLFYKEESYIAKVDENHFGWEIEGGINYYVNRTIFILSSIRLQSFLKYFEGLDEKQQLGGIDIRIGIGHLF
jgi:opacity protein-like surface antigen